jgi:hypothetical protein
MKESEGVFTSEQASLATTLLILDEKRLTGQLRS